MPHLANFTLSPALLREHLAQAGILLTEATVDLGALRATEDPVADVVEINDAPEAAPPSAPAVAVPIVAPSDLQPGDPLTGQAPVLVSQDYQPVDQAGARQLAALGATGGQVTCLLIHIPTKQAIALLSQLQERHELDETLDAGQRPSMPELTIPGAETPSADDLTSGPQSLALFGRMEAEEGARKGELFHTTQLSYHQYGFKVDFDNLLVVPERLLNPEKSPAAIIYELWNQGVDAARAALNVSLNREDYLRNAVIRQARQKGYDGIMYGTEWVQLIS